MDTKGKLNKETVKSLKEIAKEFELTGYSKLNKQQLICLIVDNVDNEEILAFLDTDEYEDESLTDEEYDSAETIEKIEAFRHSSWEYFVALAGFTILWLVFSSTRELSWAVVLSLIFLSGYAIEAYDLYRYINYYNENVLHYKEKTNRFYYNRPEIIKKIQIYFYHHAHKFVIPLAIGCIVFTGFFWFIFLIFLDALVHNKMIAQSTVDSLSAYGWLPVCWIANWFMGFAKKFFKKRFHLISHALEYSKYAPK